eukprot:7320863-Alexandrium_andersonii.AAC.1
MPYQAAGLPNQPPACPTMPEMPVAAPVGGGEPGLGGAWPLPQCMHMPNQAAGHPNQPPPCPPMPEMWLRRLAGASRGWAVLARP